MKSEWCSFPKEPPHTSPREGPFAHFGGLHKRVPRKRMVCPVCKRRMIARIIIDEDGGFCRYAIPRHKANIIKPKGPGRKVGRARIGAGRGATIKNKNVPPTFIDGKFKDPKKCPKSKRGKCPNCRASLETGYGYAGGYGLGSYKYCKGCRKVYDFVEDKEEDEEEAKD